MNKKFSTMMKVPQSELSLKNKWKQVEIVQRLSQFFYHYRWMLAFSAVGLLLGRAIILDGLMCFALAFYAVTYHLRRELSLVTALSLLAGHMLSFNPNPIWLALEIVIAYLLFKGLQEFDKMCANKVPIIVFVSVMLTRMFQLFIGNQVEWYSLTMVIVEASLAFVLTYVFTYALPVMTLARKIKKLKSEEVICVMIMLACMMTGMTGWMIEGLAMEHIFSRYLLLIFALAGGAPLGAAVGVIMGLILSLANFSAVLQISILAFAGLLAGLLREGGKMASAFGLMLGVSILTLYTGTQQQVITSIYEIAIATILLAVTPKKWIHTLAKFVPGTYENANAQYESTKLIRQLTSERVSHYANMFKQLSSSFYPYLSDNNVKEHEEYELHGFIERVAAQTCKGCRKYKICWGDKELYTHKMMREMMLEVEKDTANSPAIKKGWSNHCIVVPDVLTQIAHQYELYVLNDKWKQQLHELKGIVADQLYGVSQVMDDLSKEITREGQALYVQEEQIRDAVESLGLSVHSIDIISLEVGNVEIEVQHSFENGFEESRKIIAPLLSSILGENIAVKSELPLQKDGVITRVIFISAKQYEVNIGVAGLAKGGDLLSGDSFSMLELDSGKYAVAISDGMGNGERARLESSTALNLLQQLLQSGMNEKLAVKSVNSILLLRSPDEVYATVDLAIIDLYSADTTFMKIGSTPSFIKRGHEVITVCANNLPIGIIQDIDIDVVHQRLQPGDVLIMMSDGIYDAPGYAVNKELWMRRIISEIVLHDPQQIADELLDKIVRYKDGHITDDMTVLVTRIDAYTPEWSTFKWNGLLKVDRKKQVS